MATKHFNAPPDLVVVVGNKEERRAFHFFQEYSACRLPRLFRIKLLGSIGPSIAIAKFSLKLGNRTRQKSTPGYLSRSSLGGCRFSDGAGEIRHLTEVISSANPNPAPPALGLGRWPRASPAGPKQAPAEPQTPWARPMTPGAPIAHIILGVSPVE